MTHLDIAENISQDFHLKLLEALIFTADTYISEKELIAIVGLGVDVRRLLHELADSYKDKGIVLRNTGDKWSFTTSPQISEHLRKHKVPRKIKMSRAQRETLSIIAYHQPISRSEIAAIRGISEVSGGFSQLIERAWIAPVKTQNSAVRAILWQTTDTFLHDFSLNSLNDLPNLQQLRDHGLLNDTPDIIGISQKNQ